uniref:Uncharacterized protein n=1 Tax=Rhizophagus irregularis (strain DAOM 181602 / DAOM 197198 / MUCL 43194) TaxID=747089 RepID=U9TCQ0_RHIID
MALQLIIDVNKKKDYNRFGFIDILVYGDSINFYRKKNYDIENLLYKDLTILDNELIDKSEDELLRRLYYIKTINEIVNCK